MGDHMAGHDEKHEEHDEDRTELEGTGHRWETGLGGSGGEGNGLSGEPGGSRQIRRHSFTQRRSGLRGKERYGEVD